MAIVGSIRSMSLATVPVNVISESEFKIKAPFETEAKATTGETLISQEKQVQIVEGIQVDASDKDTYADVLNHGKTGAVISASFSLANGDIWSGKCTVSLGEYSVKTGVLEISLIPAVDWSIA